VLAAALEDTFNVTQSSVAVSGGTAVIGATQAGPGAVYVRVRSPAGTWSEQQKLVPSDVPSGGRFGYAVAIDGNTLVASAPGVGTNYGAVYVFVRTGTSWALQQKLTHADNYTFGTAVAVSGDRLAIRQNGYIVSDARVHVYERSGTSWTFKNLSVAYNDEALALSGNNLAWTGKVTAPSGSKDVIVNGQSVMVVPDNADISLALDGSTLAVGQIGLSGAPGKLQLFSGPSWSNAGTMTGPNGGFGSSVSLSGPALLTNNNSGEVPLFARVGNVWSSTPAYSFAPPSTSSVSLSGLTAAVRYSSSVAIYRLGGLTGGACGTTGECIEPGHTCVDSVCCTSACTGGCEACSVAAGAVKDGTCVPVGKGTACGAYVCTGASGTCPTSCAADADCAPGKFCSAAGACVDQKLQGAACVPASDCKDPSTCTVCKSGLSCVEGFCCNSPCAGACDSCSAANGATANGTCTVLGKGTTPIPAGGCNGLLCGGGNAGCPASCATSADCITNNVCTSGSCVGPKALGSPCSAAGECASNFCVDGACCNAVCNGQCEACDGGGGNPPGSCTPVVGKPHGTRPQCSGTGLCAGKCGGADPTSCTFPGLGTPCALASCSGDVVQPEGKCDGVGTCTIPNTSNCVPYTCDSATTACTTSCASDGQCAQGSTCNATTGKCASSAATCADSTTVKLPNGQTQSCEPYKCLGGACQQQCTDDSDCVAGHHCEAPLCLANSDAGTGGASGASGTGAGTGTGGAGGSKKDSGGEDGGCGCETPRRGAPPASSLLVGLIAALAARRGSRARPLSLRRPAAAEA
jgi:hypothetical protein